MPPYCNLGRSVVNHLILISERQNLHVTDGKLISGHQKIAVENTRRMAELREFVKVW